MKPRIITSVITLSLLATMPAWGQTTVIKREKTEVERKAQIARQRQQAEERARQENEKAERFLKMETERKQRLAREQFLKDSLEQAEMRELADGDVVILDEFERFYYKDFDEMMWKFHTLRIRLNSHRNAEIVKSYSRGPVGEHIKIPAYVKKTANSERIPLTRITDNLLQNSYNIKGITLPSTLKAIGDWAFWGSSGIKSIVLPDSLESIGKGILSGCSELTFVSIPSSLVEKIPKGTFYGCYKLKSITVRNPDGTQKEIPVKSEWK